MILCDRCGRRQRDDWPFVQVFLGIDNSIHDGPRLENQGRQIVQILGEHVCQECLDEMKASVVKLQKEFNPKYPR